MRLAGIDDVDIRLDKYGQLMPDSNGECMLCGGMRCWMQDIWLEMLTDEGELIWEDQEGMQAYGYSLTDYLNAEQDEDFKDEISAQIIGKMTKREYIDDGSISLTMEASTDSMWVAHVQFRESDGQNVNIDIHSDGKEIDVT